MIPFLISLAALALSIYAWRLAVKQKKKAAATITSLRDSVSRLNKELYGYRLLCNGSLSGLFQYTIRKYTASVAVCKERDGDCCIIKYFADDDRDYNIRCAEELLEKLREE